MRIVTLLSGGLDSTALLYHLLELGAEVRCLGVNYGQRHHKELISAKQIAEKANVEFQLADLTGITQLLSSSALTNASVEVPEGHYSDEVMKITVVPNRNMIMLAVAIGWAVSTESDAVAYAAHAGDHTIYPDCRSEFVDALEKTAALANWHKVGIVRPFIDKTKTDVLKIGKAAGAPFELTWSCYKGEEKHCGKCGTCIERREAFELAQVPDPTEYQEGRLGL